MFLFGASFNLGAVGYLARFAMPAVPYVIYRSPRPVLHLLSLLFGKMARAGHGKMDKGRYVKLLRTRLT